MKAIEFEATSDRHTLRVSESVPDGVKMRVLILIDDTAPVVAAGDVKALLCDVAEDLDEDDLARQSDHGRDIPEWLSRSR